MNKHQFIALLVVVICGQMPVQAFDYAIDYVYTIDDDPPADNQRGSTTTAAFSSYSAVQIDQLTKATRVNNNGAVSGQIKTSSWPHAALWENGAVKDLGMAGCRWTVNRCWSLGESVNDDNVVVGETHTAQSWPSLYYGPWSIYYAHEMKWENGVMSLEPGIGWEYGTYRDINNLGNIAGHGRSVDWINFWGDYVEHPYVVVNGNVKELGGYGQYGKAFAISEQGAVTGEMRINGMVQAFLWKSSRLQKLGTLGGQYSVGNDVTDNPIRIVGYSLNPVGTERPFIWQDGNMTELTGAGSGNARAINQAGFIVGQSDNKAVIWKDTQIRYLNDIVAGNMNFIEAIDINEPGQILVKEQSGRFYLLNPQ